MSTPQSRVNRLNILDKFCGDKMKYSTVDDLRWIDAWLYNNTEKIIGFAKIFSKMGKFGSNPVIELPLEDLDLVYEYGIFLGKVPAAIVKFRDKIAYQKLDNLDFKTTQGKTELYQIPINKFVIL